MMNWGKKITLLFIGFVLFMISMVIFSMKQEFHMVEKNYYEEEIAYQAKITEIKNGHDWPGNISVKQEGTHLAILFDDADQVDGKIKFFRPSDADLDFWVPLSSELTIPIEKFKAGNWKVSFRWTQSEKKYFKEQQLFIQR